MLRAFDPVIAVDSVKLSCISSTICVEHESLKQVHERLINIKGSLDKRLILLQEKFEMPRKLPSHR